MEKLNENKDNSLKSERKKKYKCYFENCNEEFRREVAYDKHIYTHTGIKKYKCSKEKCEKSYTNSTHLKRHIQTSHELCPNFFPCNYDGCGQTFTLDSNLKRHIKEIHRNVKKFSCPDCDLMFIRKSQLKVHSISHSSEDLPHKCGDCGAGFANIKLMRHHKSTVHKKSATKCNDCDKTFLKWTDFVSHRREFHATKFKCPDCEKVFFSKCRLKIHSICHKDKSELDQVFKCPDCDRDFKRRNYLKAHIRQKHSEKRFKCEECDKPLSTKQKLKEHVLKIHKSMKPPTKLKKKEAPKKEIRKEVPKQKSTLTSVLGWNPDPEVEHLLLTNKGAQVQIEYSPIRCGAESGTDTESEATKIRDAFAF